QHYDPDYFSSNVKINFTDSGFEFLNELQKVCETRTKGIPANEIGYIVTENKLLILRKTQNTKTNSDRKCVNRFFASFSANEFELFDIVNINTNEFQTEVKSPKTLLLKSNDLMLKIGDCLVSNDEGFYLTYFESI